MPAFYSDWFFERLKVGYLKWINPFNRKAQYISTVEARVIVFWVFWNKIQIVNPVTIFLTDRAKNILKRIEFFDQNSKPLDKKELTELEKEHYLREISLDIEYYARFYSKANYRIKLAGREVDDVVRNIRELLGLFAEYNPVVPVLDPSLNSKKAEK